MIYQITVLCILAVFYGCYFLKMIRQNKAGIHTDMLGKGKRGFIKFIEVSLKITAYIAPIAEIISIVLNTSKLPEPFRIIGVAAALIGVSFFVSAMLTMKNNWRAGIAENERIELVSKGIFSVSRNPAFLGFDLLYIGALLTFFNWPLFLISVFAIILFHLQIVIVEENHLRTVFGNEYLAYCKRVCRYLGRKRQ